MASSSHSILCVLGMAGVRCLWFVVARKSNWEGNGANYWAVAEQSVQCTLRRSTVTTTATAAASIGMTTLSMLGGKIRLGAFPAQPTICTGFLNNACQA